MRNYQAIKSYFTESYRFAVINVTCFALQANKMNVKLAVQTLSTSVANSLSRCSKRQGVQWN